ncbi:hypothetical protein CTAYLR_004387 [Chrysophaeum taylorii]|uniref:Alpha-galactosidase n=1 Tax=Chrysophaeum taylorii TaxID=2483200 RepID=A0AAD7ULZ3_9STRA|nr:hypothetical protein CTAYLR_004387 [Chrysophaeum taylorii]
MAVVLPPMGWMSWEVFRCNIDCSEDPSNCIGEVLYMEMGDALVQGGYLDAGYKTVSIDDCWEATNRVNGSLVMDPKRFPNGPLALSTYLHERGVNFGIYSDEGRETCEGYPGSGGYEQVDAATFARWGVDYLKYDGCNDVRGYETGYPSMGAALAQTGRNITFSCSWPAYLGDNETEKPYAAIVAAGCALWRNWHDIQCSWDSLVRIIDHWGNYSAALAAVAAPGRFNDPDMLLVGNECITIDEARAQFAIWCIVAAPLIMGNDLRNVSVAARALLLNDEAIAINQDPAVFAGGRLTPFGDTEIWTRPLLSGDLAVALLNKGPSVATMDLNITQVDWKGGSALVRDVFERQDIGTTTHDDVLAFAVAPHDVALLRLSSAPVMMRSPPHKSSFFLRKNSQRYPDNS